jgi:hypothetical protein
MNKTIGLVSRNSVGCTFAEWSIFWLSGQTEYFNVRQGKPTTLTNNPVRLHNSHNHHTNNPESPFDIRRAINILTQQSSLTSLYPSPGFNSNYQCSEIIECFSEKNIPMLYMKLSKGYELFDHFIRYIPNSTSSPLGFLVNNNESDPYKWRQKIILDNKFLSNPFGEELPVNYGLTVESKDFWHDTETTMQHIMNYFELSIKKDRLETWIPIAKQWVNGIMPLIEFVEAVDGIADSIANGDDKPLNLTTDQQIVVQHILLFKHKLLLKNYEKFPTNAKDVYLLLEPNTHKFSNEQLEYMHSIGF